LTNIAWAAGIRPKSAMEEKRKARKERNFPVDSDGESSVTIVNIPSAVTPPR